MPMLDAYIPEGALSPNAERELLAKITDLLLEHEGVDPSNERARPLAWVFVHRPQVYVAGAPPKSPRYRFMSQVPEGQYDDERRAGVTATMTQAVAEAVQMTGGGAESVAECVGLKSSFDLAIGVARPGGVVGFVGVPHVTEAIDLGRMFNQNISLRGGVAPVRAYIPDLMDQVLAGKIDPSPVLEMSVDLEGVPEGYAAMDSRKKIKVMVRP